MSDDEFKYREVPTGLPAESALDAISTISTVIPWIGGPVSNVLNGLSVGRKIARVNEVLDGLAADLRDFKSQVSEDYVKTDEFEELLENTLRKAAEERNEQKRRLLRQFLVEQIQHPGRSYDDQKRVLNLLEDVEPEHMLILKAVSQPPEPDVLMRSSIGSVMGTLERRLSGIPQQRLKELVGRMDDLRIINLGNRLQTMMTASGAADLRRAILPLGQALISCVRE